VLRAPHRQLDDLLVQPITADPEGVVHALVRAGDEAVERHGDAETQFGHLENGMASVGKACRRSATRCSLFLERDEVEISGESEPRLERGLP
jgi:hypothetical protein